MGKILCGVVLLSLLASTGWGELLNGDFEYWSDHPDDPIWAYITTIQDDPAVGWYAHEDVDGWADPWIDDGYGGYEHIVGTSGDRVVCISWGDPLAVVSQNLGITFVPGQTYTFSMDIFGDGAGGEHWCIGIGTDDMGNLNAAQRQRDALALAASNAVVGSKWALGDTSDYTVLDPPDTFAGWQTRTVSYTATARDAGKEIVVFFSGGFIEVGSDGDTCFDNAVFAFDPLDPAQATSPQPADGAVEVAAGQALNWTPGADAKTHDVYLGTVFDEVDNADRNNPIGVLLSQGQDSASYDPEGPLEFSRTYYWRVDEVTNNTVVRGNVWSFTVEPLAYPIIGAIATASAFVEGSGPEKTADGSGLDESDHHSIEATDMWLAAGNGVDPVWIQYEFDRVYQMHEMRLWNYNVQFEPLLGIGIKSATIELSQDGADWMTLGDVELAQGAARPDYAVNNLIALNGVPAKYVRLTAASGFGMTGQFGLSEVRFMVIPAHARDPQPADGATEVDVNTTVAWRAGRGAVSHDVHLGTDQQAVADGTALVDTVTQAEHTPSDLEFGSTYYWKVDEVNEAAQISVWQGDLWTFSTQNYAAIDDMEDYDDAENRIYDAWLDGWTNDTGSQVGYIEEPFAERTIVHQGRQSMPLAYDNSAAPFYSAVEKDLGGKNLAANGADSLRLFVSGLAPAFHENTDGTILMNGIGEDIWGVDDQFRFAYRQLTGDGAMVVRLDDLDSSPSGWVKAGPMIRQNVAVGAAHSFMALTGGDGNGASWQGRESANANSVNADATEPIAPPYWARIDRAGDTLTGFISPDGATWTQVGDPRTIAMDEPVLIGLALTSHNTDQPTSAAFSNVSFTGNVSATWQVAGIGATQPAGNDPQPIYVALDDTVVIHPDATITGRSGWTEWVIPLAEFGNVGNVQALTIGVGNPNTGGSGAGRIFIDDIGFGRPAPGQ